MSKGEPARTGSGRPRSTVAAAAVVVGVVFIAVLGYQSLAAPSSSATSPRHLLERESARPSPGGLSEAGDDGPDSQRSPSIAGSGGTLPGSVWPDTGQAAYLQAGQAQIQVGPNQHAAPIASVAKVMTAYVVLRDHPLQPGEDGPTITLSHADVADTARRRAQNESVVPIAAGERLTEYQALVALLLPSANNIAAVLARWDTGSADGFVAEMNATARSLGMMDTRYTDPSGYDDTTVSTAADQVLIVDRAMRLPVFAGIVAMPSATLPVAGTVRNTDALLGHNGFVGVKTGSDNAAGGCFAFQAVRWIDGQQTTITGVVLGQAGRDQIAAGLAAADAMVDRIASQ